MLPNHHGLGQAPVGGAGVPKMGARGGRAGEPGDVKGAPLSAICCAAADGTVIAIAALGLVGTASAETWRGPTVCRDGKGDGLVCE